MKIVLFVVVILVSTVDSYGQRWINAENARQFKGELVNVIGYIDGVKFASNGSHQGALLTFQPKHSVRPLRLVIAPADLQKFRNLEGSFLNNYVHVKGHVSMRKGIPYIRLTSPEQIRIVHEAPEWSRYEPL